MKEYEKALVNILSGLAIVILPSAVLAFLFEKANLMSAIIGILLGLILTLLAILVAYIFENRR